MPKQFNQESKDEDGEEPVGRANFFASFIACLLIALVCYYFGGGFDTQTQNGVNIKLEQFQSRYNERMKELDYEAGNIQEIHTDKNLFAVALGSKTVVKGTVESNGIITSIEYINQGEPGSNSRQESAIHLSGIISATNHGISSKERAALISNLAQVNSVDPLLGGRKEVIVQNVKYTIMISPVNGIALKAENK